MPREPNVSYRQLPPGLPGNNNRPANVAPKNPKVTLDRIAALPTPNLEGQVVSKQQEGLPAAKLMFRSLDNESANTFATADSAGRFQVTLASGKWLVYTHDTQSRPVLQAKVEVNNQDVKSIRLISD
jgi:hypothetical protein